MRQSTLNLAWILLGFALLGGCGGAANPGGSSGSSSSSSSGGIKNHAFFLGSASPARKFRSDYAQDWQLIATQFSGTWSAVESKRGTYDWTQIDDFYHFARANNIHFHHSALIWGAQQPAWLTNLNAEQTKLEIEDWISQFCARYADAEFITVVNEPSPGHQPARHAQKAFGDDWIMKSFELARKYCPNSMLLVSDFNLLGKPLDVFASLITPAVNAGLVDGIGVSGTSIQDIPAQAITATLDDLWNRFQLPIYITEYAIAASDDAQLTQIQPSFIALYNHPKVRGISFFGDIKGESWLQNSEMFYEDHTPRPAMQWLQDYVKSHPKN